MFKKISLLAIAAVLSFGLLFMPSSSPARAAELIGVPWGKTILIPTQIGKVTLLKDSPLYKLSSDGKLLPGGSRVKGSEFRVYQYQDVHGGLYGLGAGLFIMKDPAAVKYETPSTHKKMQLARVVFFDDNILTQLEKGVFKGQPFSIDGSTDIKRVFDYYKNAPVSIQYQNDALAQRFGQYSYYNYYPYDQNVHAISWINDYLVPITPHIIRERVGRPDWEGISDKDSVWTIKYIRGAYEMYFTFDKGKDSQLNNILLKRIN